MLMCNLDSITSYPVVNNKIMNIDREKRMCAQRVCASECPPSETEAKLISLIFKLVSSLFCIQDWGILLIISYLFKENA